MEDINNIDIVTEAPDFSMFGLFMQADAVVKSVIIILIIASIFVLIAIKTHLYIARLRTIKITHLVNSAVCLPL